MHHLPAHLFLLQVLSSVRNTVKKACNEGDILTLKNFCCFSEVHNRGGNLNGIINLHRLRLGVVCLAIFTHLYLYPIMLLTIGPLREAQQERWITNINGEEFTVCCYMTTGQQPCSQSSCNVHYQGDLLTSVSPHSANVVWLNMQLSHCGSSHTP